MARHGAFAPERRRGLAEKVDPAAFLGKFSASTDQPDLLVRENTVTIAERMELAPAGTQYPTATLYNTTMYLMAGLLVVALVANAMIRPVEVHHHMNEGDLT